MITTILGVICVGYGLLTIGIIFYNPDKDEKDVRNSIRELERSVTHFCGIALFLFGLRLLGVWS